MNWASIDGLTSECVYLSLSSLTPGLGSSVSSEPRLLQYCRARGQLRSGQFPSISAVRLYTFTAWIDRAGSPTLQVFPTLFLGRPTQPQISFFFGPDSRWTHRLKLAEMRLDRGLIRWVEVIGSALRAKRMYGRGATGDARATGVSLYQDVTVFPRGQAQYGLRKRAELMRSFLLAKVKNEELMSWEGEREVAQVGGGGTW
jgi:hypothetical protein